MTLPELLGPTVIVAAGEVNVSPVFVTVSV
jgi:hypothetical protein